MSAVAGDSTPLAERLHRELVKARVFGRSLGARLDRYVVLDKLGEGGTGAVFVAHDPTLDRKVAIKLLSYAPHHEGGDGTPPWAEALEQEARAMARLSHPNVVHVYEVGEREGQRYLVMELVAGTTLRTWQGQVREQLSPRRAVAEIASMYAQAGRGLAAAHRAGLVHRDFKPDNVLVDDEGRARVCDFGLARVFEAGLVPDTLPQGLLHRLDPADGSPRTAMVGTPGYMAPEQLRGEVATERTDQFAFCVALLEALDGERPFAGHAIAEIFTSVLDGRRRPPPKGSAVPRWLRRACERGLARDPHDRWPTMDALVEALTLGRRRARVRTGLAAAGVLAAVGGGVQSYRSYDTARRVTACEASGNEVERAFGAERRQAVHDALVATGVSHAATTADKVMPWLEEQAVQWRRARVEACLDADVRGRWDADQLDRSLWCLDERRMELEALVDELTRADATVLEKAVLAAASLQAVAPCRDEQALAALVVPQPADRARIGPVRADVARVESLLRTGRYEAGLEQGRTTLARAEALGWPPLVAAARLQLGGLLERTGAYAEAEAALEGAYFEAAPSVAPTTAVDAATLLVFVVGYHAARHADARRWGRHAEVVLASARDGGHLGRARLLAALAVVHRLTGAYDEARTLLDEALAIEEEVLGPAHPAVAKSLRSLAVVHHATGAYERARALHERAIAIEEEALGPEHPSVAAGLVNLANVHQVLGEHHRARALHERALAIQQAALGPAHINVAKSLNNLANVHKAVGAYDEAKALYERAIAIAEAAVGTHHPTVAGFLGNLAAVHSLTGDYDEALALHQRALTIHEQALGPAHPDVAASLVNLASVHHVTGAYAAARASYERALGIQEGALGAEHPDVATTLTNLGLLHQLEGAHVEASASLERALAIHEKALGPEHPAVAHALVGLAEVALARGRPGDAVALARRAVTVRERAGVSAELLADARFLLARAAWEAPVDAGGDRARALALAAQARDAHRGAGQGSAEALAEVAQWLRERAP